MVAVDFHGNYHCDNGCYGGGGRELVGVVSFNYRESGADVCISTPGSRCYGVLLLVLSVMVSCYCIKCYGVLLLY